MVETGENPSPTTPNPRNHRSAFTSGTLGRVRSWVGGLRAGPDVGCAVQGQLSAPQPWLSVPCLRWTRGTATGARNPVRGLHRWNRCVLYSRGTRRRRTTRHNSGTPAYKHILVGGCACGVEHGFGPVSYAPRPSRDQAESLELGERHAVYSATLDLFSLGAESRADLLRRGLTEEDLDAVGYRCLPRKGTAEAAGGEAALACPRHRCCSPRPLRG